MTVLFDKEVLFRRIRRWSPSGLGCMATHTILHQMGGRAGVDPYGWREPRIRAAIDALAHEGSVEQAGPTSRWQVTAAGIRRYESGEVAE